LDIKVTEKSPRVGEKLKTLIAECSARGRVVRGKAVVEKMRRHQERGVGKSARSKKGIEEGRKLVTGRSSKEKGHGGKK